MILAQTHAARSFRCYFSAQPCAVGVKTHLTFPILLHYEVINNSDKEEGEQVVVLQKWEFLLSLPRVITNTMTSLEITLVGFSVGVTWEGQYRFHHCAFMFLDSAQKNRKWKGGILSSWQSYLTCSGIEKHYSVALIRYILFYGWISCINTCHVVHGGTFDTRDLAFLSH